MKNKKHITFRIEPDIDEKVKELAEKNRVTLSEQYRFIIKKFFSNWFKEIFK